MREMELTNLRHVTRDQIREAYRIHQAMLGDSTDVNRANAQTAEEVHVAWHEITRLDRTRDILDQFYLPLFGNTSKSVEMDFVDPTPTSSADANDELTAKSAAAKVLVDAGWDPHQVLSVVGLPPMSFVGPPMAGIGGGGGGGQSATNLSESEEAESNQVATIVRNALRDPLLLRNPEMDEVASFAHDIRVAFGTQGTNGHRRKETV
jgi:hypothetical protein